FREYDEIPRLHRHFLVTEPDRAFAFEDVLNLVGVGMQMLRRAAVLDRDGRAIHRDERLVAHAARLDGRYCIALQIAGVDDLGGYGVGGKCRAQDMGYTAAG